AALDGTAGRGKGDGHLSCRTAALPRRLHREARRAAEHVFRPDRALLPVDDAPGPARRTLAVRDRTATWTVDTHPGTHRGAGIAGRIRLREPRGRLAIVRGRGNLRG